MKVTLQMKTLLISLTLGCAVLLAADPAVTDGMSPNGRAWNGLGGSDQKLAVGLKFSLSRGVLRTALSQAQSRRPERRISLKESISACFPSDRTFLQ